MNRADRLVHLNGYAALAGVLASASWSGLVGPVFGYLFVVAVVGYDLVVAWDVLTTRVAATAEKAAETTAVRADGGPRETDDVDREVRA